MLQILDVVRDRGSRYAVSGGPVADRAAVIALLSELKRAKKFAKATHNTWAVVFSGGGADGGSGGGSDSGFGGEVLKNDDGEAGAAAVIVKMLARAGLFDHVVVVTRWYGGVHLGGDRFAHIVTCVRSYLSDLEAQSVLGKGGKGSA
jgi:putative IMPACT (imprinted ancient) family translation regulator